MVDYVSLVPILLEALEELYSEPRPGKHVSDVVLCPRQSVFRMDEPVPLTQNELNFFSSGRAVHAAYEGLFTKFPNRFHEQEVWLSMSTRKVFNVIDKEGRYLVASITNAKHWLSFWKSVDDSVVEKKSTVESWEGYLTQYKAQYKIYLAKNGIDMDEDIMAHIDLYDQKHNQPYEAKTSRTAGLKAPKGFHVEQLKYYMALLDAENGGVFYQYLVNFDPKKPSFQEFPIKMTKEERQKQLDKLISEWESLDRAKKTHNAAVARHIMDNPDMNWKCVKKDWKTKEQTIECPYYHKCAEINSS